ncbi:MAG: DUF86 domain-containing protein [Paludibacteraceae bacterium]|nr:DUF86 domain-containing protein [Paludibacteraceae bacterium]
MSYAEEGWLKYTPEQIQQDHIVYYGFVKQLEIMGEATYKLSKEFREAHSATPWNRIEGMRHVLVHGYYAINFSQLIRVITNDLPVLKPQIETYIKELSE